MTRELWIELLLITAACMVAVAAIPLSAGEWGWSWDALNHHVYLGLISQHPRWHLDVMAASVQGWQYPYLYWPVYQLAQWPIAGATAGAIWSAFLAALIVPPVWLMSLRLLHSLRVPSDASGAEPIVNRRLAAAQAIFERCSATLLALLSVVVLSAIGTTSNDPLAAVPLLWAIAMMMGPQPSHRRAALAAALWGVSVAFKPTAVLAAPLLLVWWYAPGGWRPLLRRAAGMALGGALGFGLAYLPWGWQLWQQTGNPIHPFLPGWFGG